MVKVLAVAVIMLGLVLITGGLLWYANEQRKRGYQKDVRQMEQTEQILSETETDPIDRELEREEE